MDIQLAIQGGGAKIWALLAAMHAIQELEAKKSLRVTRIAGTSAGAIVGCLFAAGIPFSEVREYLKSEDGSNLADELAKPSLAYALWKIIRGRPVWNANRLVERISKVFADRNVYKINDFSTQYNKDVFVITTDLREGKAHTLDGDASVGNALLDSAGLPFCFRTWTDGHYVDGGLCENLPLETLIEGQQQFGPVIAISFTPVWKQAPSSLGSFALSLLDTAINNSVERAKRRLGSDSVFNVRADVGTFDFHVALEKLNAPYDAEHKRATVFFANLVSKHKRIVTGDPWRNDNVNVMRTLGQIYEAQHKTPILYETCEFVVEANSFLDHQPERPDNVYYRVIFHTMQDPVHCYRLSLSSSNAADSFLTETVWEVFGPQNDPIQTFHLPALDSVKVKKRFLLLFFKPVLPPKSGPYTLVVRDRVDGLMRSLRDSGSDDLQWTTGRAATNIHKVALILHVPDNFKVSMSPKLQGAAAGRRMTPGELASYPRSAGFHSYGWIGTNIDPDVLAPSGTFGADIKLV